MELYLKKVLCKDIDIDLLARGTSGFTGADIENMVNQAAVKAASDGAKSVSMKYLEISRDKILMGILLFYNFIFILDYLWLPTPATFLSSFIYNLLVNYHYMAFALNLAICTLIENCNKNAIMLNNKNLTLLVNLFYNSQS